MRTTMTAVAVALFTLASTAAYAGGCSYGHGGQSTKAEAPAST
ncbi:MAG: hypothetical protein AAGK00_11000 [Pseudomonadota bacterium]